jgi:DNA primase
MDSVSQAKEILPLPKLLARYGIKVPAKDKFNIPCPLHREQKGRSFAVSLKNGTRYLWNCHGKCQCGGDEITFIEKFEGLSKADAIKRYLGLAGVSAEKKWKRKKNQP